jgi:NAD(P)-dependent dehydrogenase (short-subunit alcohol dehydrogenase family)
VTGLLQGKTVVVSGVGPGLGREIAAVVLRDGGNVAVGARSADRLEEVAKGLDPSGERIVWRPTDITADGQPEALVAAAVERFGALDGLVNCAALDSVLGGLDDTSFEDWERSVNTNVVGTMRMTKAATDAMAGRGGSIVIIGTQASVWPRIMQTAYAASKGALLSAVPSLAMELGPKKIRVNAVLPTWMWGPPVEGYVQYAAQERGVPAEVVKGEIEAYFPLGEIPTDGDVAEAVGFFLSDRARSISGQTLLVNGGEFCR